MDMKLILSGKNENGEEGSDEELVSLLRVLSLGVFCNFFHDLQCNFFMQFLSMY